MKRFKLMAYAIAIIIASVVILSSCDRRHHVSTDTISNEARLSYRVDSLNNVIGNMQLQFDTARIQSVRIYYYIGGERVMTGQFTVIGEHDTAKKAADDMVGEQSKLIYVDSIGIYIDEVPRYMPKME